MLKNKWDDDGETQANECSEIFSTLQFGCISLE